MSKGKNTKSLTHTNYGFYIIFGIVTYFIWCDLSFFGELAAQKSLNVAEKNSTLSSQVTIKLRMQDHVGHYIFLPLCEWIDRVFKISEIPWVTPNLITATHFCIAMLCGRLLASKSLAVRRLGVLLYEFRSMLDAMDGVVYRAQSKSKDFLSGWGTYGYMIDGLADTIGGLFLMLGVIYRLNRYPPFRNPELLVKFKSKLEDNDKESAVSLLSNEDSCNEEDVEAYGLKRYSRAAINLTIVFFTVTVIMRSALWDHFNHSYHDLLGKRRTDIPQEKQIEVLGYSSTWFCLWLWTVNSADAFVHFTLCTVFFGKLWEWLKMNIYAAIPNILVVTFICQIHMLQMRNILGVAY